MKKIGIVSLYYKSLNYGGNLQAYALCKFLQRQGYEVEQICFIPRVKGKETLESKIKKLFSWGISAAINKIFLRLKNSLLTILQKGKKKVKETQTKKDIQARQKSFERFNQEIIPHSKTIYYADTIVQSLQEYDVFITGSDQVWNFRWYHPIYFLDFVPKGKKKISYAASVAMDKLSNRQKQVLKRSLVDYDGVSVREQDAVDLLAGLTTDIPKVVIDPTLLLSVQDWDEICEEYITEENYIFCYFLGENSQAKALTKEFAKIKNLKIIAILPPGEESFGDITCRDASPEQFLGYIKGARFIFTDSFHATVISNLYKKQYFIFNRDNQGEMRSRIDNITELFNTSERFCVKEKENIEYIQSLNDIDYTFENIRLEKLKRSSKIFLLKNIKE